MMDKEINSLDRALILMTRVPKAGATKTRLMPELNGEECVAFHEACLMDLVDNMISKIEAAIYIFYTGEPTEEFVHLFPKEVKLIPQSGADLGERMAEAFCQTLQVHECAVMIGSDIPNLDKNDLEKAFISLENGEDLVFGPALDGGYYLIGMHSFHPELFTRITWGGEQVLNQTLERVERKGLTYHLLRNIQDIDTFEDLCEYVKNEEHSSNYAYQVTCQVLSRYQYLHKR